MTKKPESTREHLITKNKALGEHVKRLESKLAMSHAAFLNMVGKSLDGVLIVDQDKIVVYANYAAMALFDKNIADLLGEPLNLSVDPIALLSQGGDVTEITLPRADGSTFISEISILKTEWNDAPSHVVSFRDITERKKEEEILSYMAEHDFMTNLSNRAAFEKQLHAAMHKAKSNREHMAVLYLDLDNFKLINDTLGHDMGDVLLKKIARLLRHAIRTGDAVARVGGDEFALILNELRKPEYAGTVARNILKTLDEPFNLEGKKVYSNASIGVAVYSSDISGLDLLKQADMAMYAAKKNGKNQVYFYSQVLNEFKQREDIISAGLRNALQENQFFVVYQPIIELKTKNCIGFEALLRWQHPTLGVVYPEEFLSVAERSHDMPAIGQWVMRQVFSDYKKLASDKLLFVSVNVTANELADEKTVENLINNIKAFDVDIHKIILELTETSFIKNPEILLKKLKQLAKVNVRVAIDDYGMGYSSLSYLKRLPVSILKIDKSFIDEVATHDDDKIIVKSTLMLAHNLGMKVIAEGIETREQFEFLEEHGCDYAQGFYVSKPLKLKDIATFLRSSF